MPLPEGVTRAERERLLGLFSKDAIKAQWPRAGGTKEAVISVAAGGGGLSEFVSRNIGTCKQHVHIFDGRAGARLPAAIAGFAVSHRVDDRAAVYVLRCTYTVVLQDSLERDSISFLWPVGLELHPGHVVVRVVSLEKNIASRFEQPVLVQGRTIDEGTILGSLAPALGPRCDIHAGIKRLWQDGFMDAHWADYRKPSSTAREVMDDARGIREFNPALYQALRGAELLDLSFRVPPTSRSSVTAFSAKPGTGFLGFPRYSGSVRGTDYVVREILSRNR